MAAAHLISELERILQETDNEFEPALSVKLNLQEYAAKMARNAVVFATYEQGQMAAFIAIYCNNTETREAFMTLLAVGKAHRGKGLGANLVETAVRHLQSIAFRTFSLEVYKSNEKAIKLYGRMGFKQTTETAHSIFMSLTL